MSNILLRATSGGSTRLKTADNLLDLEYTLFSNDIESRVLSGAELTAVGIVGANPVATLWANGDITGSSDNGSFTKFPNGDFYIFGDYTTPTGAGDIMAFPLVSTIEVSFSATVFADIGDTPANVWYKLDSNLKSSITLNTNYGTAARSSLRISWSAIGRWK